MTETAREALLRRSRDTPAVAEAPKKSARELLAARAAGKTFEVPGTKPAPTTPLGNALQMNAAPIGVAENALSIGSNMVSSAAGGIAGAATGLWNISPAGMLAHKLGAPEVSAGDVTNAIVEGGTYQPRTEAGQGIQAGLSSRANPLTWPGRLGTVLGDTAEDLGAPPIVSAGLKTLPDAAVAALGMKGLKGKPGGAVGDESHAFAGESASASAVAPDLSKVSSPVRAKFESIVARGGKVDKQAWNRIAEADSLGIQLSEGQAKMDPDMISRENNARAKEQTAANYQVQNQQLIDKLDEFRAEAAPNAVGNDHIQNGQSLIDSYKTSDEPVRADISAKYQALKDANGGKFPVNGKAFVEAADAKLSADLKSEFVPPTIEKQLNRFRDTGDMTFEQFEAMRTNLAAEMRKASRAGDGNAEHAMGLVREALEELPMVGETANIKPLADAARSAAKARFDKLKIDPAYRAAVDDPTPVGEASPLADDFINKFVIKGKSANIAKMREHLASDPQAGETIAAGVMNYLKSKSGVNLYTNEGNFSQAGFNRVLGEVTPKLKNLVPEATAENLQKLGNVARYTQMQPRGSFVNNSNTFVAHAAEGAATVAEQAANVAVPGLQGGTFLRKKLVERADRKAAAKAWEPGAGLEAKPIKLNKLMKPEKK